MKKTILMAGYTNYGRDPRVRREAETLAEAGFKVVFLSAHDPGECRRETQNGVDIIKIMQLNDSRGGSVAAYVKSWGLFFVLFLWHLLKHPLRYDLIHVNNMPDFLVFAAWLPRLLGRPVIHDIHDLMPEIFTEKFEVGDSHWIVRVLRAQERWAGRMASAVLTVEERLKDILVDRGFRRSKVHVLMNLPDDRIFRRRTVDAKPPGAPFVIVYHGTLARRLGLDVALHAVAKIGDAIPKLELRIIGGGEERKALVALREQLGLLDRVTFSEGYVPVEKIPDCLQDVDVGLVPNRVTSGTDIMLPTKLLEYVTVGIPCIVPPTGTIRRYFDERMVRFFEAENADSLAREIIALYRDPGLRDDLAREATSRFADTYCWSRHKNVYIDLVRRLVGEEAADAPQLLRSTREDRPIPK